MGLLVLVATVALFFVVPAPAVAGGDGAGAAALYRFGIGLALVTGVVFTAAYAWRVAADAEKLELALATTQDVLQREQRLAALGGLAAAAAHELGTPLATIQVVAKELLRASAKDGPAAEDARPDPATGRAVPRDPETAVATARGGRRPFAEVGLKALLEEVVEPHRGFDLDVRGVGAHGLGRARAARASPARGDPRPVDPGRECRRFRRRRGCGCGPWSMRASSRSRSSTTGRASPPTSCRAWASPM